MSDPLLRLISSGLTLWLKSRCDRIGDLDLELRGSGFGLLRGRLAGVNLTARDVLFQGLPLQHVEINSEAIAVDLNVLKPDRALALQHPFRVTGSVTFQGNALNKALLASPWNWLGDWLAEQLMGVTPLGAFRILGDALELEARLWNSLTSSTSFPHHRLRGHRDAASRRSRGDRDTSTDGRQHLHRAGHPLRGPACSRRPCPGHSGLRQLKASRTKEEKEPRGNTEPLV